MFKKDKNNDKEILAAAALLLCIAKSDEKLVFDELNIIKEIICDFFNITHSYQSIYDEALSDLKKSTDIYIYSKVLNETFSYIDKLDFISCIFEVAYIDGELHYMEEYFIKKISKTLNVNNDDFIKCKMKIKKKMV